MFGFTVEEVLGRPLQTIPPGAEPGAERARASTERDLHGLRLRRRCKDGAMIAVRLWTTRIRDDAGTPIAMLGVFADDTEQLQREAALSEQTDLVRFLQEIAIAANEAQALEPALRRALTLTCEFARLPVGHGLIVDQPNGVLRSTGMWAVSGADRFEPFRRNREAQVFKRGEGLPGSVWSSGQPNWIFELEQSLGEPSGLTSGLAFPLVVRHEVVAVLEFFAEQPIVPDDALRRAMATVGIQLGRIVERQRLEREKEELFEQARKSGEEARALRREKGLSPLSAREIQVLERVACGEDNLKIGALLGISERTVKAHLTAVLRKLHLENRTQAARFVWELGAPKD
jgi:DNA-binding CsgD family transcriptional regulator